MKAIIIIILIVSLVLMTGCAVDQQVPAEERFVPDIVTGLEEDYLDAAFEDLDTLEQAQT